MMGIYYSAPLLGPSLGPILGGVLTQGFSWRATFWFLAIFSGLCFVSFIPFKDTFRRERSLTYQAALKRRLALISAKNSETSTITKVAVVSPAATPQPDQTSTPGQDAIQTLARDRDLHDHLHPNIARLHEAKRLAALAERAERLVPPLRVDVVLELHDELPHGVDPELCEALDGEVASRREVPHRGQLEDGEPVIDGLRFLLVERTGQKVNAAGREDIDGDTHGG